MAQEVPIGAIVRERVSVQRTPLGNWAYFVPQNPKSILVLAHGYPWPDDSRTQDQLTTHVQEYARCWQPFAREHSLVLLVPAFGSGDLAGYRGLFGTRIDADAFVLALAKGYAQQLGLHGDGRLHLYGHSAGGQFASRFLVAHPEKVAGVVLSAPGTFPFPREDVPWPYGMAAVVRDSMSGSPATGKPAAAAEGARYTPRPNGWIVAASSVPVRIVMGGDDDEPRVEEPGQVGHTRIARAEAWTQAMNDLAMSRHDSGTVALRFVPGVAHDPVALTPAAQQILMRMLDSTRETVLDSVTWLTGSLVDHVPDVPRPDAHSRSSARKVSAAGIEFFVREQGTGIPLVLIPGGPGNTQQSFHPYFDTAAGFAHVIYYDPRGTGDSDWEPGSQGYSAEQAVDDLDALRSALGIDRWVVLGWSFGGVLAQRYALRFGAHVAGLVLLSTSVAMNVDVGESAGRRYMSEAERERIREIYRVGVRSVVPLHSDALDLPATKRLVYNAYLNGEWKRQFYYRPSFRRMAQVAQWEWVQDRNYTRQVSGSGFSNDLTDAFLESTIPTLIIEGRWDPEWGAAKPKVLREQFPRAEVHVLDGASHNAFAEQPRQFFELLRRFVVEVRDRIE